MSSPPPNSLGWRIDRLEEDVKELQRGQPAVIAERVRMLSLHVSELKTEIENDMEALRGQIKDFRRIFVTVFSGLGLTVAGAVIALIIAGGGP